MNKQQHVYVAGICEWVKSDVDPTKHLVLADLKVLYWIVGLDVIELKGAVGPWQRYALYWAPL